jgi:phosphatidylethanolamine-binding protein (PEBP) family uncharacterized protein
MNFRFPVWLFLFAALLGGLSVASAHLIGDARHDAVTARFTREFGGAFLAQVTPSAEPATWAPPAKAEMFAKFAPAVSVRSDGEFLWVSSRGLPAHNMMIGITAWQRQVPLPQSYTGANAWRIPLRPQPAAQPVSIKDRFLRGAIALAANGIPIFNPQNNRGEISFEIGELDQWGGHCGRADDYHYHIAPLHLQTVLGRALPIACALDGYPIYGLTEPDGSSPGTLDVFNGHETAGLGYHYHASNSYPYVNGGFHGTVVEREEQVDPQPRAQGVRPALTALRGARIVAFEGTPGNGVSRLRYTVNGKPASLSYEEIAAGRWKFQFTDADGSAREEVYQAGEREPGGGRGKKKNGGPPKGSRASSETRQEKKAALEPAPPRTGALVLRSPAVGADGILPVEFTGDGASISPPLAWSGAPEGTKAFAVIMHHVAPDGELKWYWTLYNLPATTSSLPKAAQGIGTAGSNSINRRPGYAPPHSKGPGVKFYTLTLYALSAPVAPAGDPAKVDRASLLAAMQGRILDRAELQVSYTRPDSSEAGHSPPRQNPKRR